MTTAVTRKPWLRRVLKRALAADRCMVCRRVNGGKAIFWEAKLLHCSGPSECSDYVDRVIRDVLREIDDSGVAWRRARFADRVHEVLRTESVVFSGGVT